MLDRLVGLETEYVLRFHPRQAKRRRVPNAQLFEWLLKRLRAKVPLVSALGIPQTWFLATGGSVRFEHIPFYGLFHDCGFVEGATPECRGAKELLRHQRAQDALLSQEAAGVSGKAGRVALLKISHDSGGHVLGCHENYEASIGVGWELWLWRVALCLAAPLLFVLLLCSDLVALLVLVQVALPIAIHGLFTQRPPHRRYADVLGWVYYVCRTPVERLGALLVWTLAFRRARRRLLAFLITRTIICGTGMVRPDGQFVLSPRAALLRSVCSVSAVTGRSVFYFGQLVKGVVLVVLGDAGAFTSLFYRRQRLQLAIGESNMAQFAEYLKVGAALLVLDAIEAGELSNAPRLRRPLQALRMISADPDLQTSVALIDGRYARAVEIQRFYLNACRRFVQRAGATAEALEILGLWEETLDDLEEDSSRLVGKLDWVTKRYLLTGVSDIAEQRKLDLRYHELSRHGYYLRLEAAGVAPTVVEPEEVRAAMTLPPHDTPATVRGTLIREFGLSSPLMRASWSSVIVPAGRRTRVVRLR